MLKALKKLKLKSVLKVGGGIVAGAVAAIPGVGAAVAGVKKGLEAVKMSANKGIGALAAVPAVDAAVRRDAATASARGSLRKVLLVGGLVFAGFKMAGGGGRRRGR